MKEVDGRVESGSVGVRLDPDLRTAAVAARRLLVEHGFEEIADRGWSQMRSRCPTPAVVVIGEVNRGKSSLVNALLESPEVSPVGVDLTTSAYLRFVRAGDELSAGDARLIFAGRSVRRVNAEEVAAWITEDGAHVQDSEVDMLPLGAEIAVDAAILRHVQLVDTPGSGGLDTRHARLALEAVGAASVLLLVCDSAAPLTSTELRFLEEASREVDSILLVANKIDKNPRHWRLVVEEDRRLLARYAPRFAGSEVWGVSARYAATALSQTSGERRDALLRLSGVPALAEHLVRHAIAPDVGVAKGLRILYSGLRELDAHVTANRRAASGHPSMHKELIAQREHLQRCREREGQWREYLQRDLSILQSDMADSLERKLDRLQSDWRAKIEASHLEVMRRSRQLFVAEMTADIEVLMGELSVEFSTGLNRVVESLFDIFPGVDIADEMPDFSDLPIRAADVKGRGQGLGDPQMVMMGFMGSSAFGPALATALGMAAASAASLGIGAAAGGVWVAVNLAFRAVKNGKSALLEWLTKTSNAVRIDVTRYIARKVNEIRPTLASAYRSRLQEAIAESKSLLASAEQAARRSQQERAETVAEWDAISASIARGMDELEAQLARLSSSAQTKPDSSKSGSSSQK
ncbi:dynamin family protein [Rhodococcus indonesiensis]